MFVSLQENSVAVNNTESKLSLLVYDSEGHFTFRIETKINQTKICHFFFINTLISFFVTDVLIFQPSLMGACEVVTQFNYSDLCHGCCRLITLFFQILQRVTNKVNVCVRGF